MKTKLGIQNSHELARKILIRHFGYVKNRTWITNVNLKVAQGNKYRKFRRVVNLPPGGSAGYVDRRGV